MDRRIDGRTDVWYFVAYCELNLITIYIYIYTKALKSNKKYKEDTSIFFYNVKDMETKLFQQTDLNEILKHWEYLRLLYN
jgi:hypothetical protein